MRLAAKRSSSGWTVRSFLATMYQLGFDLQTAPSTPSGLHPYKAAAKRVQSLLKD